MIPAMITVKTQEQPRKTTHPIKPIFDMYLGTSTSKSARKTAAWITGRHGFKSNKYSTNAVKNKLNEIKRDSRTNLEQYKEQLELALTLSKGRYSIYCPSLRALIENITSELQTTPEPETTAPATAAAAAALATPSIPITETPAPATAALAQTQKERE